MNTHITSILPAEKTYPDRELTPAANGYICGFNEARNYCAEAIIQAIKDGKLISTDGVSDLVRCPSEQQIIDAIFAEDELHGGAGTSNTKQIAKALLALLHRTGDKRAIS